MTKGIRLIALLLLCSLMLTSCSTPSESMPSLALPTFAPGPAAPIGDAGLQHQAIVPLYLPARDGQMLMSFHDTLTLSRDRHPAENILRHLLSHPGSSSVQPIGGAVTLSLSGANPVEISGSVCTVNLSAGALMLSCEDLYTAALAIAATLREIDGIDYVNLLVAGTPVAMDVAGYLPLGLVKANPAQELTLLWEQMSARRTPVGTAPAHTPLTATAALYFPLADGSGILAEPRRLSFPGQHPQQMVTALLSALSAGAELLEGTAKLPDLNALMLFLPEVSDLASGGRRITLHFSADVENRLRSAGCDPACVFAAITTTLTSFVPSVQQVCILVGDGALTSLYSPTLGSLLFPGALQTRAGYAHALMTQATLYQPDGIQLAHRSIALPYRHADNPRALLLHASALGTIPQGLTDADILGLAVRDGVILVNFSARYGEVIRQSGTNQRLVAYAMVNTLCHALHQRRVRFYFASVPAENLGSDLVWSGKFICNPSLIGGTP